MVIRKAAKPPVTPPDIKNAIFDNSSFISIFISCMIVAPIIIQIVMNTYLLIIYLWVIFTLLAMIINTYNGTK